MVKGLNLKSLRSLAGILSASLAGAFLISSPLRGQTAVLAEQDPSVRVPPSARAFFAADGSPRVDGRLDDAVWRGALVATGFTQVSPEDGTEPSERTEIRIAFDEDALYIAARMFDSDPAAIVGRLGRRDSYTASDQFEVSIDSYHDHRTSFVFNVNPAGVRGDQITTNDNRHGDDSWDPVWEASARIDSLGWTAEMRIPFSQLRFSRAAEQTWGINFNRNIFRKSEFLRWSWAPNTEEGYASLFGHLHGIRDVPQPRRLELIPYTVATSDFTEGADPNNPFNDGSDYDISGGLDVRYGLTSDITLNATINPDFGQVEADPAVVNLSAFETFFSERRPFFVEGANLFEFGAGSGGFIFGAPRLFYSRRIGRAPSRYASESGSYVDNPGSTSILGAAKISGRTGAWSIGFLDAVTARESARFRRPDGTTLSEPVEPAANTAVASLRRDFRDGATGVGFLVTNLHRSINDTLFDFLRTDATTGGADFFHRFGGNRYAITATLSGSRIVGRSEALTLAQRSSARYYQRPDQDYVSVDSAATSMTGYAVSFQADKISGNWTYGTDFFGYSPGFEVNDAGFESQSDIIFHGIRVNRRWLDPGKVFRNFVISATWAQNWNFGGTRRSRSVYTGVSGQFLNYWNFSLGGNYSFGGLSDKATRGGPLMENPRQWSTNAFLGTDYRKTVSVATFGGYARNRYDGWGANIGGEINIRPRGPVSASISPGYNKSHSVGFYVTRVADATATATYGNRYVFSELDQTTLDLTVRADVSITPDFSIQLWAQPFIAAGDYEGFKELAAPATFDFTRYGTDNGSILSLDPATNEYTADPDGTGPAPAFAFGNPDFRFRSLRTNLVARWEYVPGATLFLVWNHGRSGSDSDPTFDVFDEFDNLLGDDQQNTFVVKFSYRFSS